MIYLWSAFEKLRFRLEDISVTATADNEGDTAMTKATNGNVVDTRGPIVRIAVPLKVSDKKINELRARNAVLDDEIDGLEGEATALKKATELRGQIKEREVASRKLREDINAGTVDTEKDLVQVFEQGRANFYEPGEPHIMHSRAMTEDEIKAAEEKHRNPPLVDIGHAPANGAPKKPRKAAEQTAVPK